MVHTSPRCVAIACPSAHMSALRTRRRHAIATRPRSLHARLPRAGALWHGRRARPHVEAAAARHELLLLGGHPPAVEAVGA
eukprot:3085581-Prymnesium_polylepis.1